MKKTLLLALAAIGGVASAQFTQGNLVVRVVGDGGVTTGNQPTALRQFTTAGAQVGGDLLLTNLPGSRNVTNVYGESSEGALDLSGDGRYLMVAGYDLAARDAGFDIFVSPRVIGRIEVSTGSVGLSQTFVPALGDGVRGVWSPDGDQYWVCGGDLGILNGTFNSTPNQVLGTIVSSRHIKRYPDGRIIFNGSNAGTGAVNGFQYLQGTTQTVAFNTPNGASARDFVVVDENTIYLATSTGAQGLMKVVRDPVTNTWSLAYQLGGIGLSGIAYDGTNIYVTGSLGIDLFKTKDTGVGFDPLVSIAVAGTNSRFRGVEYIPVASGPRRIAPDELVLGLGRVDSGNVASLSATDGNSLRVCRFVVPFAGSPYARVNVFANNTGLTTISAGTIELRDRSATAGLFRRTLLGVLSGGTGAARDTLVTNGFPTSFADYSLTLTAGTGALADYLGTNGRLGARIEVLQTGPSASLTPCSEFDKLNWVVTP